MLLQRIAYPEGATLEEDLYVRRDRSGVALIGEEHRIEANNCLNQINFDTYFNMFSLKKWRKYTNINNVKLELTIKGRARIALCSFDIYGFDVDETIVASHLVASESAKTYTFEYPACPDAHALSFRIFPLEAGVIICDGAYVSDVDPACIKHVNLALAICTYRREEYVLGNMEMLKREVFHKENALLHNHIAVFISDNGNTLRSDQFDDTAIHLFQNKNSGGSGGFSRSAIEALHCKDFAATHIILMDDDIQFEVYALERTYSFLSIIKDQYDVNMLGGAMFRSDRRAIQHAAGETYTNKGIVFNKINLNMYGVVDILRNEVEERINYLGWWYCCIHVDIFRKGQFSLPLFVQRDDVEFGLRNREVPQITLNGICCWHLPFEKKWSSFKNYYTIRNRSIVRGMYFADFTRKNLKKELLGECFRRVMQYSYNEANLALRAAEDYLKGLSWLIERDPQELNAEVMRQSDKLHPVEELELIYDPQKLRRKYEVHWRRFRTFVRRVTLNGWLLPAIRDVTIEVDDPPLQHLFLAKRALKYDINTGKGIVAYKSYKEAFAIAKRLLKVFRNIDKNFDRVNAENKQLHDSVITEEFWREFLNF